MLYLYSWLVSHFHSDSPCFSAFASLAETAEALANVNQVRSFFFLTALHCAWLPFKCWVWPPGPPRPPPVALWMHSLPAWDVLLADFCTLSSVCGLGQDDYNMWDWLPRGFRGGCFGKLMGLAEVGASFFDSWWSLLRCKHNSGVTFFQLWSHMR